jgi:hypothetical protein
LAGKNAPERTVFRGKSRLVHRSAARHAADSRAEALEITQFYHGVVSLRQSSRDGATHRGFFWRGQNPCAIFDREISHFDARATHARRPKWKVPKKLSKTKAKGVKQ